jgi:hypothetical protein
MDENKLIKNKPLRWKAYEVIGSLLLVGSSAFMAGQSLGYIQGLKAKETPIEAEGFPKGYTIQNALMPTRGKVLYIKKIPGEDIDSTMVDPQTQTVRYSSKFKFWIKGDTALREGHGTVIGTFNDNTIDRKLEK